MKTQLVNVNEPPVSTLPERSDFRSLSEVGPPFDEGDFVEATLFSGNTVEGYVLRMTLSGHVMIADAMEKPMQAWTVLPDRVTLLKPCDFGPRGGQPLKPNTSRRRSKASDSLPIIPIAEQDQKGSHQ